MAGDLQQSAGPPGPVRVRREELIRPADERRAFTTREAQRRLEQKERPHWALIAYGVFFAAVLAIFCVAYTTYAFSAYRGEVLPGVRVDQLPLSGLTEGQATRLLDNVAGPVSHYPVRLVLGSYSLSLRATDIGYNISVPDTVKAAEQVGRHESFFEQLIDRLPIHPNHSVPLFYVKDDKLLTTYLHRWVEHDPRVATASVNARLTVDLKQNRVIVQPSRPGQYLDVGRTVAASDAAFGALSTQTVVLPVNHVTPAIPDGVAIRFRDRVENFLSNAPVIAIGKRVITTSRADFASALSFQDRTGKSGPFILMVLNPDSVRSYVSQLATTVDRPAQNARLDYQAGTVLVLSPRKTGRTLDQADAMQQLLGVMKSLQAHARLRFKVQVTQPPIDVTNPASLGIDTLLGGQNTSFQGAPPSRLTDITNIASRLNNVLLPPNQDISFNTLVGPNWSSNTFIESERDVNGRLVPGSGGAMQQVATTFFRTLYAAGLQLEERHAHVHRFGWYEPPLGLDAVVSPATNEDLRFRNNAGKYLFIKTRIEPIRRELWIYLYGPKLGWKVSIDPLGKIVKKYPHGPDIVKQDSSLTPGEVHQTAWAHDGADTVEERTIEYPNGSVRTDQVTTHYQPWQAIILEGSFPTPTPTPKSGKTAKATPTPGTATPTEPSPTPTFNH